MGIDRLIEQIEREKREQVRELGFCDANVWLGNPAFFPLAQALAPEQIGPLLDEYDFRGALVSHWDSLILSAQDGNLALDEAAKALPAATYTVWTGLPTIPKEQNPLPGFGRPSPRLRGVRLFPQSHRYQLSPWVVGQLCEWCIAYSLPLFLWHVEVTWNDVYALATAFPKLSIVIETQWQKILYHIRDLFSLMGACENVLVESSNFIGQDYVSYLVRNFGAERLLFGSFLPVNDPYAAFGTVLDADISESEKAQIAGGNLQRLIAEVQP
jgi:hypothetical protein